MNLTGQCEADFERWYEENHWSLLFEEVFDQTTIAIGFEELPDSMKWGVYVDFFDSVGIHLHVECLEWGFEPESTIHTVRVMIGYWKSKPIKSRQEARTEAIKKACIIYNEMKGKQ